MKTKKAFTLIELLIVIGIIAILAGIIYVAVDPARRFQEARDAQRWSEVNAILNGYLKYTVDNRGTEPLSGVDSGAYMIGTGSVNCDAGCTATTTTKGACVDLAPLVDTYLSSVPKDPSSGTVAKTLYYFHRSINGRITIGACVPERAATISVSR